MTTHSQPEDNPKVTEVQSQDRLSEVEFIQLLTDNSHRIFAYVLILVPNYSDAEEVFQDVSTTLWEKRSGFRRGSHFLAWSRRIAYLKVLNFRKARRKWPCLLSDETLEVLNARRDTLEEPALEGSALASCLSELSPADRDLILLRYGPGGSPREIAASRDEPIKRIYKALERIRRGLVKCVSGKLEMEERP